MVNKLIDLKNKGLNPKKILDIGANIGEFYDICKNIWGDSEIYLVEANKNCETILKSKSNNIFIEVLGDKDDDEVIFYMTTENTLCTGNSLYLEKTKHYSEDKLIKEKRLTKTINSLFKDIEFDLIKIDTQGSELDILKGGSKILDNTKFIIIETAIKEYNIGAPLENEIISYMESIGFNGYDELEVHTWPVNEGPFNKGEIFQRDLIFYKK